MVTFFGTEAERLNDDPPSSHHFIQQHPALYGDLLYPAFDLRLLHRYLVEQCGDEVGDALLRCVDIAPKELAQRQFILAWQMLKAMELAAQSLPPPAAGLIFGRTFKASDLEGLQGPLSHSRTLAEAYHITRQNPNLTGSFTDNLERIEDGKLVVRGVNVAQIEPATLQFVFEQGLGSMMAIAEELSGEALQLSWVRFPAPAPWPVDRTEYEDLLGCPVDFEGDFFEWAIDLQELEAPVLWRPTDAALELEQEPPAQDTSLVNRIITLLLAVPENWPTQEQVAEELMVSRRTLRRRLSEMGTSYQQILNQVRCQLAIEWLQQGESDILWIGERLGFRDVSNFRHAFKRWIGKPPGAFLRRG
ncbi:AraC family transcriptional regulator [Ferrimonas balearica]|uniref:AraC family transcriptional regulator n=1 Tax=Ferrimonas balearica TaxID=44012 RepID=UPI001C5640F0|nr:AraC family transcriptional regulator [Ferrimonas balearica]MBW3141334.1 AraC family transcriptional regulator [Ferrimonas balearica]MBW3166193.1 AraC family transcriptional regulator [Ferrimonas balearica]MBY6108378.1 AraC family transcriptional regulator [Ferrimonas balearica]